MEWSGMIKHWVKLRIDFLISLAWILGLPSSRSNVTPSESLPQLPTPNVSPPGPSPNAPGSPENEESFDMNYLTLTCIMNKQKVLSKGHCLDMCLWNVFHYNLNCSILFDNLWQPLTTFNNLLCFDRWKPNEDLFASYNLYLEISWSFTFLYSFLRTDAAADAMHWSP